MPKVGEAKAIEMEVRIKAKPETIFQLLTDPKKYHKWKGNRAEIDPRPGGIYRVIFNERDVAKGEYVEVVPNKRVVFTWGWEAADNPIRPGSSRVEIDLIPQGSETLVKLRHTGLPEPAMAPHKEGWTMYLNRLAVAATGGDPGLDPNHKPRQM